MGDCRTPAFLPPWPSDRSPAIGLPTPMPIEIRDKRIIYETQGDRKRRQHRDDVAALLHHRLVYARLVPQCQPCAGGYGCAQGKADEKNTEEK